MKAFTVTTPWGWAIAVAGKRVENRVQGTNYRGPVAIHSGLTRSHDRLPVPEWQTEWERLGPGTALWRPDWQHNGRQLPTELAIGAVIAVADLVDCHKAVAVDRLDGTVGSCCEPWGNRADARTRHLVLDNVRVLNRPVPCRGSLGLWTVPDDIADRIRRELNG